MFIYYFQNFKSFLRRLFTWTTPLRYITRTIWHMESFNLRIETANACCWTKTRAVSMEADSFHRVSTTSSGIEITCRQLRRLRQSYYLQRSPKKDHSNTGLKMSLIFRRWRTYMYRGTLCRKVICTSIVVHWRNQSTTLTVSTSPTPPILWEMFQTYFVSIVINEEIVRALLTYNNIIHVLQLIRSDHVAAFCHQFLKAG